MLNKYLLHLKKRRNTERIKTSITKTKRHKTSKLLNDSTISKFVIKKCIEVNNIYGDQYFFSKET